MALAGLCFLVHLFLNPLPDADLDADRPSNPDCPCQWKKPPAFFILFSNTFYLTIAKWTTL